MKKTLTVFVFLLLYISASFASTPSSKPVINIGVYSVRSTEDNQKLWLPLGLQLHSLAPQYEFNITSYNQTDMLKAVAANILDFAIVQPIIYIEIETKYGAENISSLIRKDKRSGKLLNSYGGVIFTLSSRKDIKTLQDIRGKTIAATHKDGFAASVMQKEVLSQAGIDTEADCKMMYTGQPVGRVIEALRSGKADVGFFKSGNIEEMVAKGKLKPDELFVISKQSYPDYPYLASTPLYDEWPVVATKRASTELVKDVTIALYRVKSDVNDEYASFGKPLSYDSTRVLMQKYHIYPYEQKFGLKDVIERYAIYAISIVLLFFIISTSFAIYHYFSLKKSRKLYKELNSILSTSADGIHVIGENGNIFYFSNSFASMLDYTNEEMQKLTIFDIDQHISAEQIRSNIKELGEDIVRMETKHTRKNGIPLDVEVQFRVISIQGTRYVFASSRDITEQKSFRALLLEHNTLLESLGEGVYAVNVEGACTYINDKACQILDYQKEEIVGLNPHLVFHHTHKDRTFYPVEECPVNISAISGRAYYGEEVFITKDGRFVDVMVSAAPLYYDGNLIGGVTAFSDITHQKHSEELLSSAYSELQSKNMELELVIANLNAANRQVSSLNEDLLLKTKELQQLLYEQKAILELKTIGFAHLKNRQFEWVNETFEQMMGCEKGELQGKLTRVMYTDDEAYARYGKEVYESLLEKGAFVGEVDTVRKDGSHIWLLVCMSLLKNSPEDSIAAAMDITRQKELEFHLQELVKIETEKRLEKERLLYQQNKLAVMGEMMNNIAHQWRQPLNALAIMVQDIPEAKQYNEIDEEYAEKLKYDSMKHIKFMSQTIDDFRNFFKPDKEKSYFCAKEDVMRAYSLIKDSLERLNITVTIEQPEYETKAYGYSNEFGQVILNLLSNAKDVLETKDGDRYIYITVLKEEDSVKVTVCDNGGGVPEDIIDKIFEPYFTTKFKAQGTGLGLYMSKMIIEDNMGGKLTARNVEGGAEFKIVLPMANIAVQDINA